MKNGKRIMACLLLLVLALSLCSCRWLTEKRDRQAFWNNEAHTEILWKGEVYRELPTLDVDQLGNTEIVITEPDVPVLLADSFGTFASASYSGLFISFWDYSLYRENPHRIFVKDSDYEYVKKAAETEEMDHCSAMVRMSDTEKPYQPGRRYLIPTGKLRQWWKRIISWKTLIRRSSPIFPR